MQKVDLHIHTKTSNQDRAFAFSEDRLKEYITNAGLDCIAVTNHNLFDKSQFEQIRSCVEILVLPGIEVDVEKCQILVLSDGHNLDDFDQRCAEVSFKWNSTKSTLPYGDFTRIFGDLNQYILIPHYLKDPKISQDLLAKLASFITAGEVSSPKKFVSCIKDADKLVPVYFSDCRMSADLNPLPTRQTYLDCGEVSFGTLREVLRDKNKVALTEADGNKLFQVFPDGQRLSTGLNVVLGDRSSGKSHTLQRISDWFGEDNVKFVRQFDLVARNEAEDERKFKDFLSERTSIFSKDYLECCF